MSHIYGYHVNDIEKNRDRVGLELIDVDLVRKICTERDIRLYIENGERRLRDMGYSGVIDRLQRAGILANT